MELSDWTRPGGDAELYENEIHIWRARLEADEQEYTRLKSLLNEEESSRANRFVFPHDRQHFTIARGTLRDLLGKYLHCLPEEIKFQTSEYGKPSLADRSGVRFNLSHSYDLAVYVFSVGRELGIDLEKIRSEFATGEIADRYFSANERRELRALPEEQRTEAFFLCWTRKEAYVKALGDGLQMPLDTFDVSLTPGALATLRSSDSHRWSIRSFLPGLGYAASVVVEGQLPSIRFFRSGFDTKDVLMPEK
jgi:4'-phosphopantetheinyl transferase